MSSNDIDWNDVIKKEARGNNDEDFGKVHDIEGNYILVQKGLINKEKFYIPKDQAESYDGDVLRFRISEQELSQFQHEPPSIWDSNNSQETTTFEKDTNEEEHIPLTEERLDISKESQEDQATVTKKPVTESKTVEVPLTREEVSIERRPASGQTEAQSPIQSEQDIKIPLKREEAKVSKKPYLKEEAVIKKKRVTNKKDISEDVTSEELDTSKIDKE
ncbi:MAG TPA: YsnF/AvaK domain-containing protein [Nitrososphaeraceae archaeon]|nr:YsnF/AvaK domain-containing protein [Nitrososphaeraceae archaeon]